MKQWRWPWKRSSVKRLRVRLASQEWGRRLRWGIGLGLLVLLVLMFPRGRAPQFADLVEGSISTRRIVAPFDFDIQLTDEEYRRNREEASQRVLPVYLHRDEALREVNGQVDAFFREIYQARFKAGQAGADLDVLADSLFSDYPVQVLDAPGKRLLLRSRSQITHDRLAQFQAEVKTVLQDMLAVGILDTDRPRTPQGGARLFIPDEEDRNIQQADDFFILGEAKQLAVDRIRGLEGKPELFNTLGFRLVDLFLRPNLIYDAAETQRRIEAEVARVPMSSGFVYENEKIVDKNERITPEIRKKLVSLARQMVEKGMQEGGFRRIMPLLGSTAFVALVLFLLVVFVSLDRPALLHETKAVLLISLILLLVSLITFVLHHVEASEYLIPAAMGGMLLALLYDAKLGYAGAAVMALLAGGLWGNVFGVVLVSFAAGVVGVLTTLRVRNRSRVIHSIFILIGTYLVLILLMGALRLDSLREMAGHASFGALNGLLMPIITFGLLPLIESTFGITTDFSLLELSNFNHPLLKKLSMEAPGTYHHSIIVGNLAEAAAQAVGANSLLARTGSYYHDIGKAEKPEYFVENQLPGENPHAKLTPRMSALILMNHVKKGLELAEAYKLPRDIKDIITQHQGTTVMNFFYNKALEKGEAIEVSEEDYRYPGPRPQSKEAAIVMLADVVEAASRTLKNPTHSRLKGLIGELVDGRFKEGQLDLSPLTLRDLERIKESFLTILAGTFHARVEYPEREEAPKGRARRKEASGD